MLRECFFAYVILVAFMAGGRTFMQWLQLSDVSLTIAGGIILFLIALRMVFPHPDGVFGDARGGEPFLVPLAVPSIAGPSALATVMLMASRDPAHMTTWVIALTVAMARDDAGAARGAAAAGGAGRARDPGVRAPDGAGADGARRRDAAERRQDVRGAVSPLTGLAAAVAARVSGRNSHSPSRLTAPARSSSRDQQVGQCFGRQGAGTAAIEIPIHADAVEIGWHLVQRQGAAGGRAARTREG